MRKLLASTPTWKCTDSEGNVVYHTLSFCSELKKFERGKGQKTIEIKLAGDATGPEQICEACARASLHIHKSDPVKFEIVSTF